MKLQTPVQMAVIGAAHGIKGELRVKTFTGDPLALGGYGPLSSKQGRVFEVETIRAAGEVAVVRFKGVSDRSTAESLTGTELFIDRSALPPEDEDEFYHADLVGLAVRDEAGAESGRVTAIQNFGGGDILEITFHGRKGLLIPFSLASVPEVNVKAGFIRIDTIAAGLAEDADEDGVPDDPNDLNPKSRPRGPKEAGGNR